MGACTKRERAYIKAITNGGRNEKKGSKAKIT